MKIKSFREKYVNNKLENKEILRNDTFSVQDAIIVYGTQKRESTPSD